MNLTSNQAYHWINDIKENLQYLKSDLISPEAKVKIVGYQYNTLYQLANAITGRVRFAGIRL